LKFGEERKSAICSLLELSDEFFPQIVQKFNFDAIEITKEKGQKLKN